ncbi:MAG TPA: glutamate synthase subunit alpha, partial [Candidatus Latescibacteria bacterium]|nr:glutamate synthase subunit alpha [Candidatus Latescibacterota bacterium]
MKYTGPPPKQGLYDPKNEHDSCGIGFVAHIKGVRSNSILRQALEVLVNLDHRGARGAEPNTGDGAGILIQIPDRCFREVMAEQGVTLPPAGSYGVGMVFLSRPHAAHRHFCETAFVSIARDEGLQVLGWRDVPTDNSSLGEWAKAHEPVVRQVFVSRSPELEDELAFERKLYVIGKRC